MQILHTSVFANVVPVVKIHAETPANKKPRASGASA